MNFPIQLTHTQSNHNPDHVHYYYYVLCVVFPARHLCSARAPFAHTARRAGGSSTEAGREGERREKDDPSDRALSSSSSRRGLKGSASRDEGPRNRAPRLIGDTTDMADGAGQGFWRAGERCGGAVYCSRAVGGCHKGPERDQTRLQKPEQTLRTTVEMKRLRF